MRAIFFPFKDEKSISTFSITAEAAKHLHVVRVRENDDLLVLNGMGQRAFTKISSISKNEIIVKVESVESLDASHEISLAIANPKKDAFEDILKIAVELGVRKIHPLTSEFSQYEFVESERVSRILESALVQSNNLFLPTIYPQESLENFLTKVKLPLYFFNSRPTENEKSGIKSGEKIILIGPEAGFSAREEARILAKSNVFTIHMPTPIQRSPTAVASSIGYLLSQGN